jgi:MFS family permease
MLTKLRSLHLHRNIWSFTFTSFLTDVSSETIQYLIPLFLYSVLGVKTAVIGLVDGIAETTASLMKVISGSLSDRLQKRKQIVVLGYSLSSLAKPFFYLAASWPAVLVIRFVDRLGKGIRVAPRDSLLAASVEKERRGLAFGISRAGDAAGAFVGILIATLIIWFTQKNTLSLTRYTFQVVVIASIIPALLAIIVLVLGAVDLPFASSGSDKKKIWDTQGLGKPFYKYLAAAILFTLGNSSDSFILLRAQERGLSLIQVMLMLMAFKVVYSVLSGPMGGLSDRIGRRTLLVVGWFAYILIYLGFGVVRSGWAVFAVFVLYGVYYAMCEGAGKAFIADMVQEDNRGKAYGLYYTAIGLAALPSSFIAGILWQGLGNWQGLGPSAPFLFGSIMAALALLVLIFWVKDHHQKVQPDKITSIK